MLIVKLSRAALKLTFVFKNNNKNNLFPIKIVYSDCLFLNIYWNKNA